MFKKLLNIQERTEGSRNINTLQIRKTLFKTSNTVPKSNKTVLHNFKQTAIDIKSKQKNEYVMI